MRGGDRRVRGASERDREDREVERDRRTEAGRDGVGEGLKASGLGRPRCWTRFCVPACACGPSGACRGGSPPSISGAGPRCLDGALSK